MFGIFAARQINGFLLTLLPQVSHCNAHDTHDTRHTVLPAHIDYNAFPSQAIIPMTMVVSLIALRTRYAPNTAPSPLFCQTLSHVRVWLTGSAATTGVKYSVRRRSSRVCWSRSSPPSRNRYVNVN